VCPAGRTPYGPAESRRRLDHFFGLAAIAGRRPYDFFSRSDRTFARGSARPTEAGRHDYMKRRSRATLIAAAIELHAPVPVLLGTSAGRKQFETLSEQSKELATLAQKIANRDC
jgi:hypothetical protein